MVFGMAQWFIFLIFTGLAFVPVVAGILLWRIRRRARRFGYASATEYLRASSGRSIRGWRRLRCASRRTGCASMAGPCAARERRSIRRTNRGARRLHFTNCSPTTGPSPLARSGRAAIRRADRRHDVLPPRDVHRRHRPRSRRDVRHHQDPAVPRPSPVTRPPRS